MGVIDQLKGESFLFYGRPKTGKSTLASTFPEYVAFDLEKSGKYAYEPARRIIVNDLNGFSSQLKRIQANRQPKYQTGILDTIDRLVIWIEKDICQRRKIRNIGDREYGGGWNEMNMMTIAYLDDFKSLFEFPIFICHSKVTDDGKSLVLTKTLTAYVQGDANNIGYSFKDKNTNGEVECFVDWSGGSAIESGSQNPAIQKAGVLTNDFKVLVKLIEGIIEQKGEKGDNEEEIIKWYVQKGVPKELYLDFTAGMDKQGLYRIHSSSSESLKSFFGELKRHQLPKGGK